MQKDKEIIHGKLCLGIFYEENFNLLQCEFSKEEISKLKAMKDKTFNLLSLHPKILDIPKDLTFSVK